MNQYNPIIKVKICNYQMILAWKMVCLKILTINNFYQALRMKLTTSLYPVKEKRWLVNLLI